MNDELRHALAQVLHLLTATEEKPTEADWYQYELQETQKRNDAGPKRNSNTMRYNRKWTHLEIEAVKVLRDAGWNRTQIGAVLGRSNDAVRNAMEKRRRGGQ
jgi:hypothetical protein